MTALQYPLAVEGAATRVLEWAGAGTPVLLLHGLGSSADIWRPIGPQLAARGARVLAVDLPGHGFAGKGGAFDYSVAGHAAWLAALLDGLEAPKAHLVGSSLGGLWASGFATRHESRIASLALVGAVGLQPLSEERRRWTAEYLGRMDRESVAARLRAAVCDPAVVEERLIEQAWRMNNSPGAAAGFALIADYYRSRLNADVQLERLARRRVEWPILLAWGAHDTIVPAAEARKALREVAGTTLALLTGAKHIPQLECPDSLGALLAGFTGGGPHALDRLPGVEIHRHDGTHGGRPEHEPRVSA